MKKLVEFASVLMGLIRFGDSSKNAKTHKVYRNLWVMMMMMMNTDESSSDSSLCMTTNYALLMKKMTETEVFVFVFFFFFIKPCKLSG